MDQEVTGRRAGPGRTTVPARRMKPIDRGEALRLLGTVSLGRIIFTQHALPAVRPVNHVVDGESVVVRLHDGGALASLISSPGTPGVVVAYEADVIDPETHLGWSVVVTGYATPVVDPEDLERYARWLHPWASHTASRALRITPDLVTGFRLVAEPPEAMTVGGC
ncbi:pyridoxamine 5'-phosphate oxidase family protein [Streptomyces sp. NPDC006430]|uniref:pyridoxamine 5'-phosphate oxidase family protein n=1 Tax=Streptomyces sp. NPDC006430 TaxID=3154299 RepID=UPI0033BD7153